MPAQIQPAQVPQPHGCGQQQGHGKADCRRRAVRIGNGPRCRQPGEQRTGKGQQAPQQLSREVNWRSMARFLAVMPSARGVTLTAMRRSFARTASGAPT